MSTPMFKVLAQSLRLGQPPDATSALRVLVEVLEKQQAEIEDLRSKLSIAGSRLAYAEGRLARLLEAAGEVEAGASPPSSQLRSQPPRAPEPQRGSQRPAPPPIPAAPPIPKAPRAPSIPAPAAAAAPLPPVEAPSIVDTGFDEFNQTLVIHKRDVERTARAEAPFPLAPASERPRAPTADGTPFQRRPASDFPAPGHDHAPPRDHAGHAQDYPAQAQAYAAPPPAEEALAADMEDAATVGMADSPLVDLTGDDGEGATVTDRVAREALAAFAELEARHRRGPRGG